MGQASWPGLKPEIQPGGKEGRQDEPIRYGMNTPPTLICSYSSKPSVVGVPISHYHPRVHNLRRSILNYNTEKTFHQNCSIAGWKCEPLAIRFLSHARACVLS